MSKPVFSLLMVLFLLSGCSSKLEVLTSYDDDADFTSYLTFGVVNYDLENRATGSPSNYFDRRIKNSIEDQMKERGYILSDNRDLEIYYYVKIETESEMVASYPNYGGYYGGGYYGYYGGYGYGPVGVGVGIGVGAGGVGVGAVGYGYGGGGYSMDVVEHTEGTLIIDIVDVRADKVIWQGTARKSIGSKETSEREIDHIIYRVLNYDRWLVGEAAAAATEK